MLDRRQTFGATKNALVRAKQMILHGVKVRVGAGTNVREGYASRNRTVSVPEDAVGIIHGKSLLVRFRDGTHTVMVGSLV